MYKNITLFFVILFLSASCALQPDLSSKNTSETKAVNSNDALKSDIPVNAALSSENNNIKILKRLPE